LLAVAYGIDDLAAKMTSCETQSRGVDLPVAKQTVDASTSSATTIVQFGTSENWVANTPSYIPGSPAAPVGSGWITIEGNATWSGNQVTVTTTVYITFGNLPGGETCTPKVNYSIGDDTKSPYLTSPQGEHIVGANKHLFLGDSSTFARPSDNTSATMSVQITNALNIYSSIKEPGYQIVVPWSWNVDLRTGNISRQNFMY
jgi:hypothetical protein